MWILGLRGLSYVCGEENKVFFYGFGYSFEQAPGGGGSWGEGF